VIYAPASFERVFDDRADPTEPGSPGPEAYGAAPEKAVPPWQGRLRRTAAKAASGVPCSCRGTRDYGVGPG
jgi:hypothetical protein